MLMTIILGFHVILIMIVVYVVKFGLRKVEVCFVGLLDWRARGGLNERFYQPSVCMV